MLHCRVVILAIAASRGLSRRGIQSRTTYFQIVWYADRRQPRTPFDRGIRQGEVDKGVDAVHAPSPPPEPGSASI